MANSRRCTKGRCNVQEFTIRRRRPRFHPAFVDMNRPIRCSISTMMHACNTATSRTLPERFAIILRSLMGPGR